MLPSQKYKLLSYSSVCNFTISNILSYSVVNDYQSSAAEPEIFTSSSIEFLILYNSKPLAQVLLTFYLLAVDSSEFWNVVSAIMELCFTVVLSLDDLEVV